MDKDTSFQALLGKESYIVVLEDYRWCLHRDLSRGLGRNISDIQGDKRRRVVERTGAWRVDRNFLERLAQYSLRDRWPLR